MIFPRKTIRQDVQFNGLCLHGGQPVTAYVRPSEKGIWFSHGDSKWEALAENVTDTTRCSRLGSISTIEHLMSAFAGLEITDAEVELTAPELPAMDGSSKLFYEGLRDTGLVEIGTKELPDLFSRVFVQDGSASIGISRGAGHWKYEFQTGDRWPGSQVFESDDVVGDYPQIAQARTFGFEEELPMIQAAGLAKGLDENSALVLGREGYLNEARSEDEPVLHKLLDCIGDLYLSGYPIRFMNVVAVRTGHTANVKAAKLLREQILAAK